MLLQTSCFLCSAGERLQTSYSTMINEALYDRYATSYNERYLDDIDDLVEMEYTEEAAKFRESCYQDDEEEHIGKYYKSDVWGKKIKNLGVYWSYHIDVPKFFGLPIQLAFYKYYDKRRRFQEKKFKLEMGEQIDSSSSMREATGQISNNLNKDQMKDILKDLSQNSKFFLDESKAFNEICGSLTDLVKIKGKKIKKFAMLPFKHSTDRQDFSIYLQNQDKKKRRRKNQSDIRPNYAFRKPHRPKNSSTQMQHKGSMESTLSKKNICNINIQIQNAVFCQDNKEGNKLQPFKPILRNTQSINRLRFKQFSKKQSIGQIYGTIGTKTNTMMTIHEPIKQNLVNFKKRVNNNRSQSTIRFLQRPQSMTLKTRAKSIHTLRPPPQVVERKSTPDTRRSPFKQPKKQIAVTTSNNKFKKRPTSTSRSKITTQVSLKRFSHIQHQTKQKMDKLLNQKLFVNAIPNTLYNKIKRTIH